MKSNWRNKNCNISGHTLTWGSRIIALALAVVIVLPLFSAPASAADNPKIKEAMQSIRDATAALGKPKLDGENLLFGTSKINGDFTVVDAVKAKNGATSTLFAKKGTNFVRVSTNVMKDGQRAIGSNLDPAGPAYAAISKGTAFYGLVDILGKIYDTGYEPIKNDAGEVIGIYYVGFAAE